MGLLRAPHRAVARTTRPLPTAHGLAVGRLTAANVPAWECGGARVGLGVQLERGVRSGGTEWEGWLSLGAAAFRLPRDELELTSIYLAAPMAGRWCQVRL